MKWIFGFMEVGCGIGGRIHQERRDWFNAVSDFGWRQGASWFADRYLWKRVGQSKL